MKTKSFFLSLFLLAAINLIAYDFKYGDLYYNITSDSTVAVAQDEASYYYGISSIQIPASILYNGKKYSVTNIGECAFFACSGLTSITIPNSVTSIGEYAFYACSGLTSITIPNSVTSIGGFAFCDCNSLTSIIIPNSVTSIEYDAFYNTPWYDNQPAGVIYINSVLYKYKGDMPEGTSIVVKEGITSISSNAFAGCSGLKSITISNSVTSIGNLAFYFCHYLTSITIPNSVTSIGEAAFSNTQWWDNQPDGVIYINSVLYEYKGNMPEGTSIVVKEGITSISPYAFDGCSGLKSITIPNSVTSIGNYAFSSCSGLKSITIPKSVTKIGERIIERCSDLQAVVVERGNPIYDSRSNCNAIIETATNTLIAGCKSTMIPSTINTIGEYAFYRCDSLRSIIIPNGVKSIESSAFYECKNLTTISIPNSVKKIGDYGFLECPKLDSITIPGSVTDWGEYTFSAYIEDEYKESSLSSVIISNGVTYIPTGTFLGCTNLKTVVIPNSVTRIESGAFENCSSLETIAIPNSVSTIEEGAFYGCSNLTTITIPNSVTRLEEGAFSGCSNLTTITIPNSVTRLEEGAFSGCSNLTTITIPNSVTFVGAGAFAYCSRLTSVTCYAIEPPSTTNTIYTWRDTVVCDPFEGLPTMPLYVPAESVEKYKQAECWKDFIVLPLTAKPADVDEPILNPSDNNVEIIWPQDPSATTYTIDISKDGELVCSLVFDSNGVLQTIRFGAPERSAAQATVQATAEKQGFSFVVEGLESGTTYHYTINAKNSAGSIVQTYSGTFKTTGVEMGVDDATMKRMPSKFIRNGQVIIRQGDKHYTTSGIELR